MSQGTSVYGGARKSQQGGKGGLDGAPWALQQEAQHRMAVMFAGHDQQELARQGHLSLRELQICSWKQLQELQPPVIQALTIPAQVGAKQLAETILRHQRSICCWRCCFTCHQQLVELNLTRLDQERQDESSIHWLC